MRNFRDSKTEIVIAANLKVMFSFFALNKRFEETKLPAHVWITRDPYERTLSCFWDKCRANVTEPLQDCQKTLLEATKAKTLTLLSFTEFCRALPKVAIVDQHFWPQTYLPNVAVEAMTYKMEDELPTLGAILEIDFSGKVNSAPRPVLSLLTDETKAIIRNVYAKDFLLLNYAP